jgi:hypothetical protein
MQEPLSARAEVEMITAAEPAPRSHCRSSAPPTPLTRLRPSSTGSPTGCRRRANEPPPDEARTYPLPWHEAEARQRLGTARRPGGPQSQNRRQRAALTIVPRARQSAGGAVATDDPFISDVCHR